jgi:hypothetical protein
MSSFGNASYALLKVCVLFGKLDFVWCKEEWIHEREDEHEMLKLVTGTKKAAVEEKVAQEEAVGVAREEAVGVSLCFTCICLVEHQNVLYIFVCALFSDRVPHVQRIPMIIEVEGDTDPSVLFKSKVVCITKHMCFMVQFHQQIVTQKGTFLNGCVLYLKMGV